MQAGARELRVEGWGNALKDGRRGGAGDLAGAARLDRSDDAQGAFDACQERFGLLRDAEQVSRGETRAGTYCGAHDEGDARRHRCECRALQHATAG